MAGTIAQEIQHKLEPYDLKLVLFTVQKEVRRHDGIPQEDLPIEIATLTRARDRLANLAHGLGKETLLMHEWEIIATAMRLEIVRFQGVTPWPKYIERLHNILKIVERMLMESDAQIRNLKGEA